MNENRLIMKSLFFIHGSTAVHDLGLLIVEASRSPWDTPQRAAAELRLRQRGHGDRRLNQYTKVDIFQRNEARNMTVTWHTELPLVSK